MKWVTIIARVLLGIVFVGAGVTFFVMTPPPPPPELEPFFTGMVSTKYFLTLLKVTEIACGLCFLSGFFVPLALVVIAPVILNIFMVHLMLAPEGVPLAVIIGLLEIYLAFFSKEYSPKIKSLFKAR